MTLSQKTVQDDGRRMLLGLAAASTAAALETDMAVIHPKSTRRGLFSLAAAAGSALLPVAASAAVGLPDDEAEMLKQYRRLSPPARAEQVGWAKWQADRGR